MEEMNDPFYCGEISLRSKQWRFKTREEFYKESGRFRGSEWNSSGQMDFLLGKNVHDWIASKDKINLKFDPFDPTWSCGDVDFEVCYEDKRPGSYWYCSFQDLVFD